MLQHEEGKNWRYSPSKKFLEKLKKVKSSLTSPQEHPEEKPAFSDSTLIDPASLMEGMKSHLKEAGFEHYIHPVSDLVGGFAHTPSDALELVNTEHPRGMLDQAALSELLQKGVKGSRDMVENYISSTAASPVSSTLKGYALTKGIDSVRDLLNPEAADARKKDPKARMRHEMMPVALALAPTLASMAIKAP
jgi:hypothetical protein